MPTKAKARKRTGHPGLQTVAAKRLLATVERLQKSDAKTHDKLTRLIAKWLREADDQGYQSTQAPARANVFRRCAEELEKVIQ